MNQWSRKDAEQHFEDVIDAARTAPQTVAADGYNVVVVEESEFRRLSGKPAPHKLMKDGKELTFAEHLLMMPWKDGFEIERAPHEARDIDL